MRQKFSFKKIVVKFAAIASALAFAVGQFGGYTSTVLAADDVTYVFQDGTLTIDGSGKADFEGLKKSIPNINADDVSKIVLESVNTDPDKNEYPDNPDNLTYVTADANFVSNFKNLVQLKFTCRKSMEESVSSNDMPRTKDSYWDCKYFENDYGTYYKTYYVNFYAEDKLVYLSYVIAGQLVTKPNVKPESTKNPVGDTWYDKNGNEYNFNTPVTGPLYLYNTPDGANESSTTAASTATSPVITITTGTSDDDDDDDTDSTTATTAASTSSSLTVSGTNSTAVANKIKHAAAGSTVTVDMSSNKTVAKSVLEAAKGKNVEVVFDMGGYKWTINGASIGSDLNDVNLNVTFKADDIPQEEISGVAGDDIYKTISLDYDGPFGFTGFLSFDVGSENAGKYVNLYYYNTNGHLEYQTSGLTDNTGNVSIPFVHASEYVAVISDTKASASPAATAVKTTSATSPVTADVAAAVPFILLMCASAAAMIAAATYKKRHI